MLDDYDRITAREIRDRDIYSYNWIPDGEMRNAERDKEMFQLELDFLSGKKSHPSECRGCKSTVSTDCHYCEKRTFPILWDTIQTEDKQNGRCGNSEYNTSRKSEKKCECSSTSSQTR